VEKMPKLKPCPFCGGKASLFMGEVVKVTCNVCHASTRALYDTRSKYGVITENAEAVVFLWNMRTNNEK
jgi:cytochrome c peroxidase